jgi:hypothetical protein
LELSIVSREFLTTIKYCVPRISKLFCQLGDAVQIEDIGDFFELGCILEIRAIEMD